MTNILPVLAIWDGVLIWIAGIAIGLGIYWSLQGLAQRLFALAGFCLVVAIIDWTSFIFLGVQSSLVYMLARKKSQHLCLFLAGLAFIIIPFIGHETARIFTYGTDVYDLVFMTGMAFYSLRLVHYWWESRKDTLPEHNFLAFAGYIFFLPIFIIGPIYRFQDYMLWERRKRWELSQFITGLMRISVGLFKIFVLSGYLINDLLHNWGLVAGADNAFLAFYIPCIEYGLNVYLQFSGYTDIAIGFGLLLGHKVCENFYFPFIQPNIVEFWKHWHMSLTSWVRSYIFLPILLTTNSVPLGIFLSMMMIGVWHGFTWNAALWGLYHGVGINLYYLYRKTPVASTLTFSAVWPKRIWHGCAVFLNFNYVMLGNFLLK